MSYAHTGNAWLFGAGITTEVSNDIDHDVWRKLIIGSMGLACARYGLSVGAALEDKRALALGVALAAERLAVARAVGHGFPKKFVARSLQCNRLAASISRKALPRTPTTESRRTLNWVI